MEEDEPQMLISSPAPDPDPALVLPAVVPPIAPIPSPPATTLLCAHAAVARLDSYSDREGSILCPSADDYKVFEEGRLAREHQEKAIQELLMKRRAYAMVVPTNNSAVRARLRRLSELITLFSECKMECCDRLCSIMVRLDTEGQLERLLKAHDDKQAAAASTLVEDEGPQQYPFYTEDSRNFMRGLTLQGARLLGQSLGLRE